MIAAESAARVPPLSVSSLRCMQMRTDRVSDRNEAVLSERIGGDTLREIGGRHGLSPEGVRVVVAREGDRQIDALEHDLDLAAETGEHPTFLVPFQEDEGWQTALAYFQWCLDRLRARGRRVTVTTRQTASGTAFMIERETA
jgi:hypothetical protein